MATYKEITVEEAQALWLMKAEFQNQMFGHLGGVYERGDWVIWAFRNTSPMSYPQDKYRVEVE